MTASILRGTRVVLAMGFLVAGLLAAPMRGMLAQAPPLLSASVELDVGGAQDNLDLEILRVIQAIRLPDGQLLVSSGRPIAVQLFGRDGRRIRTIGRSGSGPGEYQHNATLRPWRGDSVLVYSTGTRRWMLFGLDGTLVREWPVSDRDPAPKTFAFLRGNAILRGEMVGAGGCPTSLLEQHASRSTESLVEAVVDPAGRLWVRSVTENDWTVFGPDGRATARISLPEGFVISSFDGDRVIGVDEDEDGFPHVKVVRTGLPAAPEQPGADCAVAVLPVTPLRAAEFKTSIRNALTVAEAHYADHGTYPRRASDFPRSMIPSGADFEIPFSGDSGYILLVRDRATGFRCLIAMGTGAMGALEEGLMLCGG